MNTGVRTFYVTAGGCVNCGDAIVGVRVVDNPDAKTRYVHSKTLRAACWTWSIDRKIAKSEAGVVYVWSERSL